MPALSQNRKIYSENDVIFLDSLGIVLNPFLAKWETRAYFYKRIQSFWVDKN